MDLFSLCLLYLTISSAMSRVTIDIVASPGDTVSLPCVGHIPIKAVEWYRSGQYKSYVYSLREHERPQTENQLLSYEGRVSVKNLEEEKRKRKDTDVSLTINNVRSSDSGTYECHIFNGTIDHSVTETSYGTKSMKNITLVVVDDIISVCPGDDVALTCDVPMNVPFDALHWNKYGHKDPVYSCMKNLQANDSGVYECRIASGTLDNSNKYSEVKKRVHVLVSAAGEKGECETEPGDDGNHNNTDRSRWGLLASVLVVALGVLACWYYRRPQENLI